MKVNKQEKAEEARKHRAEVMGNESIWRLLFHFSAPGIVAMLVSASYNLVDAIFVGRLGPEAVAALAVAFPITMIFVGFGMGIGVGGGSLIGRNLGAKKYEEANKVCGNTISIAVIAGLIITGMFMINLRGVLQVFGAAGEVLAPAWTYTSVLVIWGVALMLSMVTSNLLRAEGNPYLSSTTQIVSALSNVVLDPIFILGWGPIPKMGVLGAAVTTVMAWALPVIVTLTYYLMGKSSYHLKLKDFILDWKIIGEIFRIGMASIVRTIAGSAVQTIGNVTAASFGVIPLALKGVINRAASFAFMPCMGIGQGMLPLVAYNYGARKLGRIGEIVAKSSLVGFLWGTACFVFVMIFPTQVISIFGNDPEFIRQGSVAIRIFSVASMSVGTQMIMSHYFQGIGEGMSSLFLASARQIIFLLPAIYFLPKLFGVNGIWMAFPAADTLSIFITIIWAGMSFKRLGIRFTLKPQKEEIILTPSAEETAGGKSKIATDITPLE